MVIVKNDRNEEVYSQILRPTKPQIYGSDYEDQLDKNNFKRSNIVEVENIKTFQIPPIEFEGKEYKVVIEEINFPE